MQFARISLTLFVLSSIFVAFDASSQKASDISATGNLGLVVSDTETDFDRVVLKIDRHTATFKAYGEGENPKPLTKSVSTLFRKCREQGKENQDCSIATMYLDRGDRLKNIEIKHDKEFDTKLKNDPEFRVKLNKMLGKPFTTSASNPMITAADVLKTTP